MVFRISVAPLPTSLIRTVSGIFGIASDAARDAFAVPLTNQVIRFPVIWTPYRRPSPSPREKPVSVLPHSVLPMSTPTRTLPSPGTDLAMVRL